MKEKKVRKHIRHLKIRRRVNGNTTTPRLSIFRSNKHIYAQLIDDSSQKTLLSATDKNRKEKNRSEKASETGKEIAKKALSKKIKKIIFDRSGYKYHGRIKALATGAREGGLDF